MSVIRSTATALVAAAVLAVIPGSASAATSLSGFPPSPLECAPIVERGPAGGTTTLAWAVARNECGRRVLMDVYLNPHARPNCRLVEPGGVTRWSWHRSLGRGDYTFDCEED